MLSVSNLSPYYDLVPVIEGASFQLKAPDVLMVVGRNGVGKSTLLRAVLGFCRTEGFISVDGRTVKGTPDVRMRKFGFSFLPQENRIIRSLTVRTNLELAVSQRPPQFRDQFKEWMRCLRHGLEPAMGSPWKELSSLVPRLTPLLSRNADELSGGQQTLVGLAAAILACEQYLFLDEPSASIDHELLLTICDLLRKLSRTGLYAVMIAEQKHSIVVALATRLLLIAQENELRGAIAYEVPPLLLDQLRAEACPSLDLLCWLQETPWYQRRIPSL